MGIFLGHFDYWNIIYLAHLISAPNWNIIYLLYIYIFLGTDFIVHVLSFGFTILLRLFVVAWIHSYKCNYPHFASSYMIVYELKTLSHKYCLDLIIFTQSLLHIIVIDVRGVYRGIWSGTHFFGHYHTLLCVSCLFYLFTASATTPPLSNKEI